MHCFLMNFLKNNSTQKKSNDKLVQLGFCNNSVFFFCLIEIVQNGIILVIIFVFSLVAVSPFHYLSPDGTLYKEHIYLPVFPWKTQLYQWGDIVKILLGSCE